MAAGRFRKRVTFQRSAATSDGGGGSATAWGDPVIVWGDFKPERGGERISGDRIEARVAGVLTIRYSSDVSALSETWRVLIGGEPYQIFSVTNPDQRNKYLEITVERGGAT